MYVVNVLFEINMCMIKYLYDKNLISICLEKFHFCVSSKFIHIKELFLSHKIDMSNRNKRVKHVAANGLNWIIFWVFRKGANEFSSSAKQNVYGFMCMWVIHINPILWGFLAPSNRSDTPSRSGRILVRKFPISICTCIFKNEPSLNRMNQICIYICILVVLTILNLNV